MAKSGIKLTLDDRRLLAVPRKMRAEAEKLVMGTAHQIEGRMKIKIQHGPKTGRIYRHGNVVHQASRPGEAPATDTGFLVSSIQVEKAKAPMTAYVNVHAEYGRVLEYGGSRMGARPFLKPSFEEQKKQWKADVSKLIKKAH